MADDVTINVGSGGDAIAADDISSVKYQRIKLIHGIDGTNDGDVAATNPLPVSTASNGTQNLNLYRYLDTSGTGIGAKNANLDFDAVPLNYKIAPPAGTIYRIARMIVTVEDTSGFQAQEYGNTGGALANGIQVRIHNGSSTVLDLTDGIPITKNAEWGSTCYDVDLKTWGAGNEFLVARWTFTKAGEYLRLDGDASEELQLVLTDDMTGLIGHYFFVQGYEESSAT
jgi:hypothetical protein